MFGSQEDSSNDPFYNCGTSEAVFAYWLVRKVARDRTPDVKSSATADPDLGLQ